METQLKKDFSYYFIRLHLLQAEQQRRKANGHHRPAQFQAYLDMALEGHEAVKMTAKEKQIIRNLTKEAKKHFGL